MELRSTRRLRPQPPPGDRRRFRSRRSPDGLISTLPDDMLLQVLVRLRCARAAACTGALSRRWRGLWTHLTELSFCDIAPDDLDAALNQIACPTLTRLKIHIPSRHTIDPARVSSLLGAAARLAPADLVFKVWGHAKDSGIAIEIPCFNRATSIKLDVVRLYLLPPAEGVQFPLLERLSISGCRINIGKLILRCPHLRVLEVCNCWGLSMIRVHSSTIENISVVDHVGIGGIDIMAPLVKRLSMCAMMDPHFSLSFSAPMVENLCLRFSCLFQKNVGIGEVWRLCYMQLGIEKSSYVLYLSIDAPAFKVDAVRSFSQQIAPLPACSYLHLRLAKGHVSGAILSHLLGVCSTIQRLIIVLTSKFDHQKPCLPDCSCDQPQNWRTQNIPLIALEQIDIEGFGGSDDEVDFLKLLFRCATAMKRMTVELAPRVFPGSRGSRKMYSLFKAHPSVSYSVYRG